MYRAFQTMVTLHKPDIIFILGMQQNYINDIIY